MCGRCVMFVLHLNKRRCRAKVSDMNEWGRAWVSGVVHAGVGSCMNACTPWVDLKWCQIWIIGVAHVRVGSRMNEWGRAWMHVHLSERESCTNQRLRQTHTPTARHSRHQRVTTHPVRPLMCARREAGRKGEGGGGRDKKEKEKEKEKERESVCERVCVWVGKREIERERERACVCVSECACALSMRGSHTVYLESINKQHAFERVLIPSRALLINDRPLVMKRRALSIKYSACLAEYVGLFWEKI